MSLRLRTLNDHAPSRPAASPGFPLNRYVLPVLLAIIVLGALLRALHIGAASLWNDELFTVYYAKLGFHFLWTRGFVLETNPPVYDTLALGWMAMFGQSEAAIRSLSAVVSVLTIPVVFLLGRELLGTAKGLLAALLFAVLPSNLYYAQEARAYALMALCLAIAMLGMARALRAGRGGWLLYGVGAVGAIYVHATSLLVVAAMNLALLPSLLRWGSRERLRWFAANVAIGLFALPEVIAAILQVGRNRVSWIPPVTERQVALSWGYLVTGPAMHPANYAILLGLALLAILAFAALSARLDRRIVAVLIAVPALDLALILLAGLRQPLLVPRLLCWMGVPLSVLVAGLLARRTLSAAAVAGMTVVVLAFGLQAQVEQGVYGKEPWRPLLARLRPELTQAHLVVIGPWTEAMPLTYYGYASPKVRHWSENFPPTVESTVIARRMGAPNISRAALLGAIRSGEGVLLLQRSFEFAWANKLTGIPAPTRHIVMNCSNGGACLQALWWAPTKQKG